MFLLDFIFILFKNRWFFRFSFSSAADIANIVSVKDYEYKTTKTLMKALREG